MTHDPKMMPPNPRLSHIDPHGRAAMVDVTHKTVSIRTAIAEGVVRINRQLADAIRENTLAKGDLLAVARLAGIQSAKRTSDLIPLCHPLPLEFIGVEIHLEDQAVRIRSEARTSYKTGVEMEALTAVAVAALTVIDMGKSLDPLMTIERIELLEKTGGKRDLHRPRADQT